MTNHSAANQTAAHPAFDRLKNKIQQRQARIGIIGLGYVGLPLALLFSEQKFKVTGFDIDRRKVDTLAQGGSYIYRISAEEIRTAVHHQQAYQAINRGALRDPNHHGPKRVFVPDLGTAEYLQRQFPGASLKKLEIDVGDMDLKSSPG